MEISTPVRSNATGKVALQNGKGALALPFTRLPRVVDRDQFQEFAGAGVRENTVNCFQVRKEWVLDITTKTNMFSEQVSCSR